MNRATNIKESMKKIGIGLGLVTITVVLTTLAIVIFSHSDTNQVEANATKHARVVLNGQVVKAKGYDYHTGMSGHTMTVQFEDGTEATSSPNNIVVWSE